MIDLHYESDDDDDDDDDDVGGGVDLSSTLDTISRKCLCTIYYMYLFVLYVPVVYYIN